MSVAPDLPKDAGYFQLLPSLLPHFAGIGSGLPSALCQVRHGLGSGKSDLRLNFSFSANSVMSLDFSSLGLS